jgi:uncharacterized protein (UPF0264 family)
MKYLVNRTDADVQKVLGKGDPKDSRRAAWFAIERGSDVLADVQRVARSKRKRWTSLKQALPFVNGPARKLLALRLDAIARFKVAPHHIRGFRPSAWTGKDNAREVDSLCLVSGHEGQEIPGLVAFDRVVVDAEHMEQALGPASLTEIFQIRKLIGENVYISTNVSESPQLVRSVQTGKVDNRATAALTASKVVAAINAGADVVKVGFANLDPYKQDLGAENVGVQMRLVRGYVDDVVKAKLIVMALNRAGRYPLFSVFFPEVGINCQGERPSEIAEKGIELTAKAGWQGILIDTYEKYTGKRYRDFYSVEETARLTRLAHERGLEYWIAGSISADEVPALLRCRVDLICFGGAARHRSGLRVVVKGGRKDETIKRPLVEDLVRRFERANPRRRVKRRSGRR